jgi:16S rRNA (uracil1498-N3)-methyltransferase
MQVFYTDNISDSNSIFNAEESFHGIKVLRLRKGEVISFTDGAGNMYEGEITSDDSHKMEARIISLVPCYGKRKYRLHMAVSPLKNHDRFEWFIEKAVEMGVDEITPLVCERTEKKSIRRERVGKLIISAMKQSVKAYLPLLNDSATFSEFIKESTTDPKLIAHCNSSFQREPITISVLQGKDITVLIGPEGDFSDNEIALAIKHGYKSVSLGESRLRTETAGIVACCSAYLSNI